MIKSYKSIFSLLFLIFINTLSAQKVDRTGHSPSQIGEYSTFELKNGLRVILVENHEIPRVSLELVLNHNPVLEGNRAGISELAEGLLLTGTHTKSKSQLNESINLIGAEVKISSDGMFASSLTKQIQPLTDIMADVVMNAAFPLDEFEEAKKQKKSELASEKDNPSVIVANITKMLNFGNHHPYGEIATEETINNIKINDVYDYYDTYYKPNNAYLVIVGDISFKAAKKLVNKKFSAWVPGKIPLNEFSNPKTPKSTKVAYIPKDGLIKSTLNVTYPLELSLGHQDAIAADVLNNILGETFSRILTQDSQNDKINTYGAHSILSSDKLAGSFSIFADVKKEVTDSSVTSFLYEMNKIRDEKVKNEDLQFVLNSMSERFLLELKKPQTIAKFALNTEKYGLPSDYYTTYLQKLTAVSSNNVMEMAKKYINPKNAHIIIVGSKSEALKMIKFSEDKKINFYNANGKTIEVKKFPIPEGITAKSVLEDFIKVSGGKALLGRITDMTMEFKTTFQDVEMIMVNQNKAPNKYKSNIKVPKMGTIVQEQIYDGVKGFSKGINGEKAIEGNELKNLDIEGRIFAELSYEYLGVKTELKSLELLEGKKIYTMELIKPSGDKTTEFYDVESKLKIKSINTIKGADKERSSISVFENYKSVNGVTVPHRLLITTGLQTIDLKVTKFEYNTGLTDEIFEIQRTR